MLHGFLAVLTVPVLHSSLYVSNTNTTLFRKRSYNLHSAALWSAVQQNILEWRWVKHNVDVTRLYSSNKLCCLKLEESAAQ